MNADEPVIQPESPQEAAEAQPTSEESVRKPVRDKDALAAGAPEGRFRGRRQRRKVSYLTIQKIETVDYKDVALLRRFINEHGRIVPCRQSGNTAKQQRMVTRAIKRAREMALLPFVVMEPTPERPRTRALRESGSRYEGPARETQAEGTETSAES
jgi:small subunit ribosomal protein S18